MNNIPVWTQILNELGSRLSKISPSRGYFSNLKNIERSRFDPFNTDDLPAINYWKINDASPEGGYSTAQRTLRVGVEYYSASNDASLDELSDKFMCDLMNAINRSPDAPKIADDVSPMFHDKNFSVTIDLMQPIINNAGAPFYGVFITISFQYRIKNTDPFTLT